MASFHAMSSVSYPPKPCRQCGRADGNWIVQALGCHHCFDPFATANHIAMLEKVALAAEDVVHWRKTVEDLKKVVADWKANDAAFYEGRSRSIAPPPPVE